MTNPILSVQGSVSNFLALSCAGAPLVQPAEVLTRRILGMTGTVGRVGDFYLSIVEPSLSELVAGRKLLPAADASLVLGLITFWNALSCLPGALSGPALPVADVDSRLRSLGLGADAAPLAASVLNRRPSEAAQQVMQGRPVTAKWFWQAIKGSDLWRRGVRATIAPTFANLVMHLERQSERDFERAIEVTRPFGAFAERIKGSRGLVPLPPALKRFLASDSFVRSALQREKRKRRALIRFLEFASLDQWTVPSGNFARFPSFESFQWDRGVSWPYNNFFLYFISPRGDEKYIHREAKVLRRFQSEHPGLERTLTRYISARDHYDDDWTLLKPVERLLYEAYHLMASSPEGREESLIS